ncbi:transcriptional regulator [Aphanothece hegewaldii CCALA 016]|uniref:Transcriptional regulator n=1 Tax=Aphanothece hegewaldii CCALA 016 TaxID=2107694 RepID=A0A2T1LV46_9CHRO|nr:helix-turn-helix domain-containing protein [Aphanothece hegewaldii]PSF35560.1 transcriptional regulator [Aphanothece hegewaldii CCALA 016]
MTQQESKILSKCPAEIALKIINGRWKLLILKELFSGTKRFNELQRALSGVTQKVLTQQLRELESDGIINRTVYPEIPPKVEYSLTALGDSLKPLTEVMHDWGINQTKQF